MTIKYVNGNLITLAIDREFELIAHGSNCFCTMGAGIAKSIKQNFPEAYKADLQTKSGDRKKLGTCSFFEYEDLVVANAYTQYHFKGKGVKAHYDSIRSCMKWIKEYHTGKKIGLPKIGCGLAKGDWETVEFIIQEELADEDVTVVLFIPS